MLYGPQFSEYFTALLKLFAEILKTIKRDKIKRAHYSEGKMEVRSLDHFKEQIRLSPACQGVRKNLLLQVSLELHNQGNGERPCFSHDASMAWPVVSAAVIMGIACSVLAPVHFRHHRKQELSKWVEKENENDFRNTTLDVNKCPATLCLLLSQFVSTKVLLI